MYNILISAGKTFSGLHGGIRTHELCVSAAVLYQLSYEVLLYP